MRTVVLVKVQRCFAAAVGVEEVQVRFRYRVPGEEKKKSSGRRSRERKSHRVCRGFRDLPLFLKRPRRRKGNLEVAATVQDGAGESREVLVELRAPMKRSIHPERVTLREKAGWIKLKEGWDAAKSTDRSQCSGRECPWCNEVTPMRIVGGKISCPKCHGQVGYAAGKNDWSWGKAGSGTITDSAHLPDAALRRCRPCWQALCRHHLYLEVDEDCGSIKFNHPDVHPDEMEKMGDTCSLDVSDREEGRVGLEPKVLPLEVVGAHLGLTLERARQIEEESLLELRHLMKRRERMESDGRGSE